MAIVSLLQRALEPLVRTGSLRLTFANGRTIELGDGTGPRVAARFVDHQAPWALLLDPDLRTGELFTDGRMVMERGAIYDLLILVLQHGDDAPPTWSSRVLDRARGVLRLIFKGNDLLRSRRNVSHHYDLDDRLYALFLDPEWQYSCAYFERPGQSLADAQRAKMRHIAAKLAIHGGERVLDIGCGWGGLACHLAGTAGAGEVLGLTLSEEQVGRARERAASRGLDGRVGFALQDYRKVEGQFDRIVSVGMFEHVGRAWYDTFFQTCRARLADDGVMLLHTIGVSDAPSLTNPWITKYIFPGGHLPALSEILPAIERAGLMVTDVEVLRLHYAETLRAWREAFMARRAEAVGLFGERFCRMWEYYLSMSESAFRCEGVVVFQIQLARAVSSLPLTRDYLYAGKVSPEHRPRVAVVGGG
ncbi:MAG: cyclopropane-fatty-acyl-phospholipid synthase family protein [Alphaproteobacteria bacterium]|nr:cyclopropane-fatty-acyl-phospholipid synthase family protein [Alphaproteobacteria bacterium]MBU1515378.1 cyclopropane-fatty-acyl-phospholipid synthase family protein [Alphaproteobacteria bacterium]MBU2092987.1 cyclopropane-fatty-acyl-phospholipid synthase family protein [Alphaproteobacteria bacterium]MBU2150109.1 cyclopropane-fatty-acyl-phospholipid synthase family protein [Alphaproteobacteria bacterium]MBU2309932.1 cyclopropane-fatty-acyl-phospholipid synthase family protein [Alphaproteobac